MKHGQFNVVAKTCRVRKKIIPIAAQASESIIMRWVDEAVEGEIDAKHLVELAELPLQASLSKWFTYDTISEPCDATDKMDSYVRVVMLEFSQILRKPRRETTDGAI